MQWLLSNLSLSVGTLLCWWISTSCPWAAKRTPAGLLQATSRKLHLWFVMLWIKELSSTQSPSITEDNQNIKRSWHLPPPLSLKTELSEQSRSEYFSREGEIQESFNCAAKIKKTALQKIAKKASVQQDHCGLSGGKQQRDCVEESGRSLKESASNHGGTTPSNIEQQVPGSQNEGWANQQPPSNCPPQSINPNLASVGICPRETSPRPRQSKRSKPSDAGEDTRPQKAKRTDLQKPSATVQTQSTECITQISKQDLLPLTPLPPDETEAASKAFPVSEYKKTTVEVELLTPGKRDQRLPLTRNNTAQTNQNKLATSLRGLSVKLASSGSSIGSRSTGGEEGSQNVPRTSRLRRLKRS
ncbi:protein SLX4IP isoform X2 [Nerophis lumbriciformis]|uniref:protein SLX4IP isoform X2 n=1 Tax=Nerophis lumbriciformis TaxID=546530 RepID=UPI002AE0B1F2|nr:protein SLX4IP isoform X2 [Nerophis lumbriciformis]XP_061843779.1 protein SLX4IP-like isoform X2 [Nerophis lumbriciformis]